MDENYWDENQEVKLEITDVLDLHPFSPKDLKTLIPDYIEECLELKIYEVRFIHGKGIGNIRRSVHALLERNSKVSSFKLADEEGGNWGATIAYLVVDRT